MPQYRLMIARFPGNHSEHPASAQYVMDLSRVIPPNVTVMNWYKSDTPITMTRNLAVKEAMEWNADYLMMIDSDMRPDPRRHDGSLVYGHLGARPFWDVAWEHMMASRDAPSAIAAPYGGPSPHHNVYVFRWRNKMSGKPRLVDDGHSIQQFTREEAAERRGVEEVAALPTGLILYDLRCFTTNWPKPVGQDEQPRGWFYYEWHDLSASQKDSTEDCTQTRDQSLAWYLSRGKQGGRCFVAWDAWAHHIKLEEVPRPSPGSAYIVAERMRETVLDQAPRAVEIPRGGLSPRDMRDQPLLQVRSIFPSEAVTGTNDVEVTHDDGRI